MQTREEQQRQKRLLVRSLARAGLRPHAISDGMAISIRHVRAVSRGLRQDEAMIAAALDAGQQGHDAGNRRHGPVTS
ncbi:MAG: hypothetical protein NVSMB22_09230 [Chloroflexota bacterium]